MTVWRYAALVQLDIDPAVAAAVGISLGTLLLGVVLGSLLARRGRRLRFDWRVSLETDATDRPTPEQPDPEQPDPDDPDPFHRGGPPR